MIELKFLFALLISMACLGCTTGALEAREAVESASMTQVTTGSLKLFACSQDDKWGREFRALNAQGRPVTGVVCCGVWFKGCTVRF